MITVQTVSEATYERYDAYLAAHPKARFGHDLEWARTLRDTYGAQIEHLIALEGEKPVGLCPLFLCKPLFGGPHYQTSLFPSYFGPLYDSTEALDAMLDEIVQRAARVEYAELLPPDPLPAQPRLPFVEQLDCTYRLSLDDTAEHLQANFRRNYRRILRDAKFLAEVQLVVDRDGALVHDFHRLYAGLYAGKHGFIPHVEQLFRNIFSYYGNGTARIYMARHEGRSIGGIFTFWKYGEIYCGWSAQDTDTSYLPMHFLIWQIIQDGVEQGYHWFNHGEAPRGNENLRLFKQGWGMQPTDTYRYFIPGKTPRPNVRLYDRYDWSKKIISHLPVSVTNTFLSPLIRLFL